MSDSAAPGSVSEGCHDFASPGFSLFESLRFQFSSVLRPYCRLTTIPANSSDLTNLRPTCSSSFPPFCDPPPTDWQAPAGNGTNDRSPSPRGARARSRSRSPVRADPERSERREGGDRGRGEARGGAEGNPGNNIHVSGLSSRVEERDLDEVFAKFGRIQKIAIMRDPHTKDSRGFAFVTMETAEDADVAITNLNATELMGRVMNVEKARRGRARTPTPGAYHGPPKRDGGDRMYDPRGGYPSRGYGGGRGYDDRYDSRGGYSSSRYDDRGYSSRGYDDRDRGAYAIPMRGDDRGAPRDDRRRYDDDRGSRRYDDRDRYDRRY
ncbi:RNA recognition motif domain-containing protein [Sporobolomyces koalae]|uniref:RNA recognition motif domain-containing protein n=1 Tax=Sporobolomyces koalae TaxID=500713 RepID=UPI00317F4486